MSTVLVIGTAGPEHPTKATLPFLVARNAKEQGHDVSLFLLGDATFLIKDAVVATVVGVGPGALQEHFTACVEGRIPIYL